MNQIRTQIAKLIDKYYCITSTKEKFIPGKTAIRYAGRVYDEKEIQAAVEASLDFWFFYLKLSLLLMLTNLSQSLGYRSPRSLLWARSGLFSKINYEEINKEK